MIISLYVYPVYYVLEIVFQNVFVTNYLITSLNVCVNCCTTNSMNIENLKSWSRKKTRYVTKSFVFMRITKKFLITILIFLAFASSGSYRNMKMTGSKESTVKVKLDLWFLSSLYWSLCELTQLAHDVVLTL